MDMYVEFNGNKKMTILVIDKSETRKKAIEAQLHRSGWLVNQGQWNNEEQLIQLAQMSQIIIVLDSQQISESRVGSWNDILKDIAIIGELPTYLNKDNALEKIEITPQSYEDQDAYLKDLMNSVSAVSYRHFYPMTENSKMLYMLEQAKRSAVSSVPVLILGETGVGKEVIAKYVHHHSRNANGPFVTINCAAIPETMIEAVLFGYEKGAFTNAISHHIGKFEKANNGTLFLDEIGEMSFDLQAKLLRVLQNNEIERLGGKDLVKVNVRIIAATNKNLMKQIELGNFRPDLYYRINVINLKCAPLRERREDIAKLAEYFTMLYSQDIGVDLRLSNSAVTKLISYDWPGNVRELQNVIYRAAVMCANQVINENDILYDTDVMVNSIIKQDDFQSLRSTEAQAIVKVLKETKGCRTDAAKRLKISPRTLRYKISKLKEVGFEVP